MTKTDNRAIFTIKQDTKQLVTGPVAIPNCPDCDFAAGEKLLTPDEIEAMAHEYNTKSRMADEMHVYGRNGETIGETVENWTLKESTTLTNINGKTVTLPLGTWMATVKVTDDTTWDNIESGKYRGFSAMYVSRSDAETILASKRTLIADLEDPVPLTISIVDSPCVYDAIFTSIKGDGMVEKAGRRISNATLNKITKVFETMKNGFDEVQHLMSIAETERQVKEIESIKEDFDMDKDEMKAIIKEAIKEETNPLWEQLESMKTEEPVVEEVEDVEEVESEPSEDDKLLADVAKRLDTLEDKLGNPTPQSIKGEDKPEKPVVKGLIDRDVFGRRLR
jgi:hypothetical protein